MKINWKVRLSNKTFWLTIIPAFCLLIQMVGELFGYTLDLSEVAEQLKEIVNVVFVIAVACGIVIDHTTEGVSDSPRAMTYEKPYREEKK